jgi:phage tail sheath gpL-like
MPALASIILNGLAASYPLPGVFLQLDFAQGPVGGSGSQRAAVLIGNKTASGSATVETVIYGPDTQTPCQTENDVINLFGAGSQLHRAYLRWTAVNKVTSLYFVAIAASAGAAATLGETIATTATANGNHRTWCVDQFVDTAINNGDTATTIAANIVLSVNSQTRWPVTANNAAGVITYTAKNTGPEGNWIRMQALITSSGTIGTTTTLTANTFLSGGATADINTNALATILPAKYYTIVSCDSDSTNLGRIVTQVTNNAQPTTGIRQYGIGGSMDTLANTITVATALNSPRAELVWGNCTDLTPLDLAANAAALYALLEIGAQYGVARKNFSLFPATSTDSNVWLPTIAGGTNLPGAGGRGGLAVAPTNAQLVSALNNGITPITQFTSGQAQLVKRCTTKSLTGANQDYRIRDAHKRVVCDYWADDAVAITQLSFGGKDLLPDPLPGAPPLPSTATSPGAWGGALKGLTLNYGNAGQWGYPPNVPVVVGLSPADVINANAKVQQENNPNTRMSALFQLSPVPLADQFAVLAQQVG